MDETNGRGGDGRERCVAVVVVERQADDGRTIIRTLVASALRCVAWRAGRGMIDYSATASAGGGGILSRLDVCVWHGMRRGSRGA